MSSDWIRNIIKYPRAIVRFLFLILNNLYCTPAFLIWMLLLLPLKKIHPYSYYWIEGKLYHWMNSVVAMWPYASGYDLVEVGDDITPCLDKRTLVLVNHQSTADALVLLSAFNVKRKVLENIMWIMDRVFLFTHFGLVCKVHKDFFIKSGPKHREQASLELRDHIHEAYIPRDRKLIVLFPEGGFLRKRLEASQRYARRNNLPTLQYVTIPRIGAMKTIIDELGGSGFELPQSQKRLSSVTDCTINNDELFIDIELSNQLVPQPLIHQKNVYSMNIQNIQNSTNMYGLNEKIQNPRVIEENGNLKDKAGEFGISTQKSLKYILDVTIAYDKKKPLSFLQIVTGIRKPHKTYLLYRLYKSSEIPKEEAAMIKWLYDRFIEKEALLSNFYDTGSFNYTSEIQPSVVHQDIIQFIFVNLFFIASTYLHFQMISMLFSRIF